MADPQTQFCNPTANHTTGALYLLENERRDVSMRHPTIYQVQAWGIGTPESDSTYHVCECGRGWKKRKKTSWIFSERDSALLNALNTCSASSMPCLAVLQRRQGDVRENERNSIISRKLEFGVCTRPFKYSSNIQSRTFWYESLYGTGLRMTAEACLNPLYIYRIYVRVYVRVENQSAREQTRVEGSLIRLYTATPWRYVSPTIESRSSEEQQVQRERERDVCVINKPWGKIIKTLSYSQLCTPSGKQRSASFCAEHGRTEAEGKEIEREFPLSMSKSEMQDKWNEAKYVT